MNGTVNKNEFIKKLTDNLPEPPAYFPSNVILNKDGYDDIDNVIKSSLNKISMKKLNFFKIKKMWFLLIQGKGVILNHISKVQSLLVLKDVLPMGR